MRIAFFTDLHANREALAACLEHADRGRIDRYAFLGDYVGYGADPVFAVETVMDHAGRGAIAVLGNHDAAALDPGDARMNDVAAAAIEWTRARLDASHEAFLRGLPFTSDDGDGRLFVHASAHDPPAWHYVTDHHAAAQCFAATAARTIFCGHTHVPALFHRSLTGRTARFKPHPGVDIPLTAGRRWLAVIGSVGQPRDRNPAACYAILDTGPETLTYVRVPYDIDSAARKINEAGLPQVLSERLYTGT